MRDSAALVLALGLVLVAAWIMYQAINNNDDDNGWMTA